MQNNLNDEERFLDNQLADFVDQTLSDKNTKDVPLSNIIELQRMEKIILQLKQVINHRNPDLAFIERLRRNLRDAWIANKEAHHLQPRDVTRSEKVLRTNQQHFWSGFRLRRPLTLGFAGVLAVLLVVAIILGPQIPPDLQATAGGMAGWIPVLIVGVGILLVFLIVWLNKKRK